MNWIDWVRICGTRLMVVLVFLYLSRLLVKGQSLGKWIPGRVIQADKYCGDYYYLTAPDIPAFCLISYQEDINPKFKSFNAGKVIIFAFGQTLNRAL